jgi:plastocyanin
MRRGGVAFVVAAVLSLSGAEALADGPGGPGPTVAATADNTFTPKTITIPPNTTVYFENRGLSHNVHFDDGKFEGPTDPQPTPWRVWRHFDQVGSYRYYCELHGGPNGQGMSGTVIVEAGASPVLGKLKVSPRRVCNRSTRRCRKTGAAVSYTLSEDARVFGGVDPVSGRAGRRGQDLQFAGKKGANSFRVSGLKLDPGLYRLTLAAEDVDGNDSDPAVVYFRVKRARR